jgi:hypothetical protein
VPLKLDSRWLGPTALVVSAGLYALVLLLIFEAEESDANPEVLAFLVPALFGGLLIGRAWGAGLALVTVGGFALVDEPRGPTLLILAIVLIGATAGIVARRWFEHGGRVGHDGATCPRQATTLSVRAQQSPIATRLLSRLVSRGRVNDAIDRLRLKLDTFPDGLYQPVASLPIRTAKRARGSESRWRAILPVVEQSGARTALDLGANAGYFSIELASLGLTTVAVESDPAFVRTALLAVRRAKVDRVGVLALTVSPDTIGVLPRTDCVLFLSLWHHIVREWGLEQATEILAGIWSRTGRLLFFDTGEDEMPDSFRLPYMRPDAETWLTGYLAETCCGSRIVHLGRHEAFDAGGRPCTRNLFAVVRGC